MSNFERKLKRNFEIINTKFQEMHEFKLYSDGRRFKDENNRYRLNMELLVWLINTDTLILKNVSSYAKEKKAIKQMEDSIKVDELTEYQKAQATLLGLYYAFNSFKHNKEILKFSQPELKENKFTETLSKSGEDRYYIFTDTWVAEDELTFEDNKIFYTEFLVGQSVYEVFQKARTFLSKQYTVSKIV